MLWFCWLFLHLCCPFFNVILFRENIAVNWAKCIPCLFITMAPVLKRRLNQWSPSLPPPSCIWTLDPTFPIFVSNRKTLTGHLNWFFLLVFTDGRHLCVSLTWPWHHVSMVTLIQRFWLELGREPSVLGSVELVIALETKRVRIMGNTIQVVLHNLKMSGCVLTRSWMWSFIPYTCVYTFCIYLKL